MALELKIPPIGESITEVQIGEWRKAVGQQAAKDENLVEIESEKATMELPAPAAGTLVKVLKRRGDRALVGEVIGYLLEQGKEAAEGAAGAEDSRSGSATKQGEAAAEDGSDADRSRSERTTLTGDGGRSASPAVRRELRKRGLRPDEIPQGADASRISHADVERQTVENDVAEPALHTEVGSVQLPVSGLADRTEEAVPMSMIRRRIAERLVAAQQQAALLTTFNEIDMSAVIALRKEHREAFQEKHGVKLGFMSFFVKAVVDALKRVPQLNAQVRGDDIIYRKYADIGIAVGGGKGLVVPVLRNAERMGFAEIEQAIARFAERAVQNQLSPAELTGGTFTISNGGIYGSLLSTPIVNPPQSGILGLHVIQERPVAREGQVVIRPMMYVALTYDHRLVDGREAVLFLGRIKEAIESPPRLLLEV